ncbi:uncharacterized protein BJ171DRAFT_494877 [Polychytrium aggregatum]|uniref:uncharacterized protein n=1 Tax=Polychytrium aggregatum TaxID=110093 RepID=UPI0022FE8244|nr:uncharacterized protein BJ171DRAFT_494877 [Polychytrium aggregatum]KAI9206821.1 hypothetical protein BJ171DRAFT_494877 [Polychytrium aggregatum]
MAVPPSVVVWMNDLLFFLQGTALTSATSDRWMLYLRAFSLNFDIPTSFAILPVSGSLKSLLKYLWPLAIMAIMSIIFGVMNIVDIFFKNSSCQPRRLLRGRSFRTSVYVGIARLGLQSLQ